MKKFIGTVTVLLFCSYTAFAADKLDFTLHKLESGQPGNTLLVVGGIQGDEPGGFNAAALIVTHYRITKGSVWVVPNLNFISIIKRSRGVFGDLNRKFLAIPPSDPEYTTIQKIKEIILNQQVDLVLNLHDGSGFYRPQYIDGLHNPRRWGQTVIIDQKRIDHPQFGNLENIAGRVVAGMNEHLFSEEHVCHVKDTETCLVGDAEMEKALTYFVVRNRKPAFGIETSKEFSSDQRSYYHLRAIESFMQVMGIEFERQFQLTMEGIEQAINSNITLALFDNKIFLDMKNARKRLTFIPFKKGFDVEFTPSSPLLAVINDGNCYNVYHGNRRITSIFPQFFEYDSSISSITMLVDGRQQDIKFGDMVTVDNSFLIVPREGYRVNVIGFRRQGTGNESGIPICKSDTSDRFSIDKDGRLYRVEVYRERKFAGMVLVNFGEKAETLQAAAPARVSYMEYPSVSRIQ